MRSDIGKNIKISIWGGSHEPAIGVDIEGLPRGTVIDMNELSAFLKRRAPGSSPLATKRKEPDIPIPLTGLAPADSGNSGDNPSTPAADSQTLAIPQAAAKGLRESTHAAYSSRLVVTDKRISLEIKNADTRSSDYRSLRSVPRPGHADYTARLRYGDTLNMAGGGPFSARMTAPLCIAGGIALQILRSHGIDIGAHIYSIADAKDTLFEPTDISPELLSSLKAKDIAVITDDARTEMIKRIVMARECDDSVGGVIEVCAINVPAGIGGAMYDGLESALAPIFFGIPAVKGVEFGAGFAASELYGSVNNDPFYFDGDEVKTKTNNHGGILGGITTGMPIIARLAFKPTPSIRKEQDSVDLDKKENTTLIVRGRHDPCVVLRAVPITEAALALGILDCIMEVRK